MRFVWTRKLSPNRQIGRISAILQDGVPRTIPLAVAWRRSFTSSGMRRAFVGQGGRSVSGQVTRTRILRVGLDLASAEGLCRITFGSVARRASMSKGGVVAHFPHLGDLKRSILDVALDLLEPYLPRSRHWRWRRAAIADSLPECMDWMDEEGRTAGQLSDRSSHC